MNWLREHFHTTRDARTQQRALDRYRMGKRAGGAIRGVRVYAGHDGCLECRALTGVVYSLDDAPPLPHPGCLSPGGCRCVYRPVMTYESEREAE